eukprot:4404918-Prymnesium_polylepis.2
MPSAVLNRGFAMIPVALPAELCGRARGVTTAAVAAACEGKRQSTRWLAAGRPRAAPERCASN